jgi:hypothetical protein
MTATPAPSPPVEIIGVCAAWWAKDTSQPAVKVIIDAQRLARWHEDPYETARYLSSWWRCLGRRPGNDTGCSSYSTDTGGGTAVRVVATGEILARYIGGQPARPEWEPFASTPLDLPPPRTSEFSSLTDD